MKLQQLLDNLWTQYIVESPASKEIHDLFIGANEKVVNDHIAIRTFDDKRVGVKALGKFFEDLGYEERGEYHFAIKKLYAKHYEHKTDESQPKIFISELLTGEFSPFLQAQARALIDTIPAAKLNSPDLLYSGTPWGELDYDIYQKLLAESEYAAWLYVFGFRANHFTVFLNHMQKLTSVEEVNKFIKQHGYKLNASGGEIKGTPEELLEQSSTMANQVEVRFKQGNYSVLNSYYEFARRYLMPNGKLYQGFIAASADKIFESTDVKSGM
jgi:hypothetical protein